VLSYAYLCLSSGTSFTLVLSLDMARDIFTQKITVWSAVNSSLPDETINIVNTADYSVASIFARTLGNPQGLHFEYGYATLYLSLILCQLTFSQPTN
jgi:hypothetical protein